MADRAAPSLQRKIATLVGVGAALMTMLAGTVVVTSMWAADQGRVLDRAELLLLDQIEQVQVVDGDVVLAPVGDGEFSIAIEGDTVVAVSGNEVQDASTSIIEDAAAFPDPTGEFISVAEIDVDGSTWATAYTSCFDPAVCTTIGVGVQPPSWVSYVAARSLWVLLAAIVVAGVASVGAVWLVTRSLHPVEAMRRELEATTATDLTRRVPVPRSGDEIEALGETLNGTLDRLETAVAANRRFVADAAHELRSPLTGVRTAVELRAGDDPDDILHDALGELDRASSLVDDLLFLAKGCRPGTVVDEVRLDGIVTDEIEALRRRGPGVNVTAALDPATVACDPARMSRAVENLLENAARYGHGQIDVALIVHDGEVILRVDDDGEGVPPADRRRVFDRFVRLDESRSRSTGGSGLGLAIVADIVTDRRGTVTVTDAPGGGARFEVRLAAVR